ncbi:hypothetical protein HmCmsJML125_01777 [Escherichia coli]|nr:hypothetical protein HmCmsJML125_01777 [Escherichia coli]GCZ55602.1 hypothetical protein HmCmsJML162_00883 [Escherichia coli]
MLIRHSQGYIPLKYMFPFLEIEEDNIYLTGLSKDNHCCENLLFHYILQRLPVMKTWS